MTNKLHMLRRKRLGAGSLRGIHAYLNGLENPSQTSAIKAEGEKATIRRNDKLDSLYFGENDWLVRWGCTSSTSGVPLERQLNKSTAISEIGDKRNFRAKLQRMNDALVPVSIFETEDYNLLDGMALVVRPQTHAQGRNLFVINSKEELLNVVRKPCMASGWYASKLINKSAEFRVYVVSGRVVTVAEKTPDDPNQVAWNVAQGGRFDVVSWGTWDKEVVECALESFSHTSLDFGGVDVMVDQEGKAYCVEINSAPSLPLLSNGRVSYRQQCMAKAFRYIMEHGNERFPLIPWTGWPSVIHPAVST